MASTSAPARSTKRSPFSDLLNIPFVSTPVLPKTGKACVLTSSEYLRLMKEKEEKKFSLHMRKRNENKKESRRRKGRRAEGKGYRKST